ncbi:hypothetical protein F4804DRAFT_5883 [Jackrogersella minutella]|nr:hypothetical protein F4804DRAFT_5883 [Jackrogersella minutella]
MPSRHLRGHCRVCESLMFQQAITAVLKYSHRLHRGGLADRLVRLNIYAGMGIHDGILHRLVLLKLFEYTGIVPPPFPSNQNSIASQIWSSNLENYTPRDPAYMNAFMMKSAASLDGVKMRLVNNAEDLHFFSHVENHLLSLALQSLPRTSVFRCPQLYSGQVEIQQLGLDHFGIEFLECRLNNGPPTEDLVISFTNAMSEYVARGETITIKRAWSFTDTVEDALHYSSGVLLVANALTDSAVWDRAAYVTPLSDGPMKTEYTFMAGTEFKVQSGRQC